MLLTSLEKCVCDVIPISIFIFLFFFNFAFNTVEQQQQQQKKQMQIDNIIIEYLVYACLLHIYTYVSLNMLRRYDYGWGGKKLPLIYVPRH